ncbi:MAG: DUF192 domain-containing protein [Steroidobacteraceae bacterium]
MRRRASLFAGLALVAACAGAQDCIAKLPQAEIEAQTASGKHRFQVWIAADDPSRERGLMFVRELPPGRGMLFLFEYPQQAAFWMKNTYIPLDLVFIDPAGVVLNVAADARPFTLEPIPSRGEAIAVLEVPAGTARNIGLAAGDRVTLPSLRTTGAAIPASQSSARPSRVPN